MSQPVDDDSQSRIRQLEVELRGLRHQLSLREEALVTLNRRLIVLERGGGGLSAVDRASHEPLEERNRRLEEELYRMHNTKLFRWATPARNVYGVLRSIGRFR